MKNIWSYLTIGLAFFSIGLITMYKLAGATVKVEVKKIKNKRTYGNNSVMIPIHVDSPQKALKRTKADRIMDRLDKRKARAQKKLTKSGEPR